MRRADRDDTTSESCHESETQGDDDAQPALQAAGRPDADQMTHHEPEIEATRMDQQPFEDVRVTAQMRAAHAAGVVDMGERAFNPLAPSTHQAATAGTTNPPTIAVHGRLGLRLLGPIAATPVRLRDVRPNAHGLEVDHALITVIPLVGDDLFEGLRLLDLRLRVFNLLGRGN